MYIVYRAVYKLSNNIIIIASRAGALPGRVATTIPWSRVKLFLRCIRGSQDVSQDGGLSGKAAPTMRMQLLLLHIVFHMDACLGGGKGHL